MFEETSIRAAEAWVDMSNEFLFRLPGWKHLLSLAELERQIDEIIAERLHLDFSNMDDAMADVIASYRETLEHQIAVEIYDTRRMKKTEKAPVTLGTMTVSTVLKKFN